MTPEDVDRILSSEEPLCPSSGFASTVMEKIRESAVAPPPLAFPWLRFLVGALAVSGLSAFGSWCVARLLGTEAFQAGVEVVLAVCVSATTRSEGLLVVSSVAGTFLLVRLVTQWTGARA